VVAILTKIYTL